MFYRFFVRGVFVRETQGQFTSRALDECRHTISRLWCVPLSVVSCHAFLSSIHA